MNDKGKTKEQLLEELEDLRRQVIELKEAEIKRRQAEEKLLQQNEYLTVLHETTLALMNRLELTDLLEAIVTRAGALVGTSHGYIRLVEPGGVETVGKVGIGAFSKFIGHRRRLGEGLGGKVLQTGQPLVVEDYHTWPGRLPDPSFDVFRAMAGVPLKSGSQVIGVIGLGYLEEGKTFGDKEVMLLGRFAQLASIALDNARLYTKAQQELVERKRTEEKIHQQNEYLTALHETTLKLMNRLDVTDLLEAIITRAAALVGTSHGTIFLVEPGETEIVLKVGIGFHSKLVGQRQKLGEGMVGKAWQMGQTLVTENYQTLPYRLLDPNLRALRAAVSVPLKSGSKVIGVFGLVYLEEGRRFGEDEVELLSRFAELASIALDNARLYTSAQQELVERKRAEEALAAEKEHLAVTLSSIGDGVITTDMGGHIVLINRAAEQLTGWTPRDVVGKPLVEVLPILQGKTRQPCENPVELAVKTGRVANLPGPVTLVGRDGSERVITGSGAPIRDQEGRLIGVVLVLQDITEKQRIEEERLKASKLESLGILAGGIAHDFNNILTAILMNLSLAKMALPAEKEAFKRLVEAEKASLRARDLTQQLLTFSKGGAPVKKTASILELIKDSANFALRGSKVRCEFSLLEDLWPVEIDQGQMSQVIHNLIINAQQAMPEGGTIQVKAENQVVEGGGELGGGLRGGRYVKLSIADQGVGIAEEHLPKIFDPYFTTKPKGSGLGLATTYSIIKRHGGHIRVVSKVGEGTTFYIYLPASEKQILSQKDPITELSSVRPDVKPRKLLVVDDEESIREAMGQVLGYLGYEGEFVRDGAEAVERYERAKELGQPFDAVILDLTIPGGLGGKETVQKLRDIDPQVKAIVSSGYSHDPVMADFRKYGFEGVVAKPYKIEELRKVLYNVIMNLKE